MNQTNKQTPFWKRAVARIIDFLILLSSYSYFSLIFFPDSQESMGRLTLTGLIVFDLYFIFYETIMVHKIGATFGKLFLRLRIKREDETNLNLKQAALRALRMLFFGFVFFIPLLNLIGIIASFVEYKTRKSTRWDRYTKNRVYSL